jgi:hypothetical protein
MPWPPTRSATALNQFWQTDFTYMKVIGWGWFYLSTMLHDYSRYIIAWKLCNTMKGGDVTDTLTMGYRFPIVTVPRSCAVRSSRGDIGAVSILYDERLVRAFIAGLGGSKPYRCLHF